MYINYINCNLYSKIPSFGKPKWKSEPKLNTSNDSYLATHRDNNTTNKHRVNYFYDSNEFLVN